MIKGFIKKVSKAVTQAVSNAFSTLTGKKKRKPFVIDPEKLGEFKPLSEVQVKRLGRLHYFYEKIRTSRTAKEQGEVWHALLAYLPQNMPPKKLLHLFDHLSVDLEKATGFADKFEEFLRLFYAEMNSRIARTKAKRLQAVYRAYKKQLLKSWQRFAMHLAPPLRDELVRLILEDGDQNQLWIRYCIPHLIESLDAISPAYIEQLKNMVVVDHKDFALQEPSLSQKESQYIKSILNTQLAMLEKKEFDWAHLNLARLAMTQEKLDAYLSEEDDEAAVDDYVDWHIEQAVSAGAELSNIDLIIAAYSQYIKKDYHKVIDLLEQFDEKREDALIQRYRLLLAVAFGRLALQKDARGDAPKAIQLLSEAREAEALAVTEQFLLCRLLLHQQDKKRARTEFDELDLFQIKTPALEIVEFALQVDAYDKIEPFLQDAVDKQPEAVPLLSCQCELYRFHRNRFADANAVIDRIANLDAVHPWVIVQQCTDLMEQDDTNSVNEKIKRLPRTGIWAQEANLLRCRIEIKNHAIEQARAHLNRIKFKKRIDYQYWQAVLHAHDNKIKQALDGLDGIEDDRYFRNKLVALQGKLLLAQGSYVEALRVFDRQPEDEDTNIHRAWACYNLKQYEAALDFTRHERDDEEIYLRACVYDAMDDAEKAYQLFKRFLQRVKPGNAYLAESTKRFALMVIDREEVEDASWILQDSQFHNCLPKEQLIHLHALNKNWQKVLELLLKKEAPENINNLVVAYQKLLFGCIRDKKWQDAEKLINELAKLNERDKAYKDYVVRAKLVDDIQRMNEKFDDKPYRTISDSTMQVALALLKFMRNQMSFEEIFANMESWAKENPDHPEPALLMLLLSLFNSDMENAVIYANQILERIEQYDDAGLQLIAKALASLVVEDHAPAMNDLLQILETYQKKLPITLDSFWHKITLAVAHRNAYDAGVILDRINAVKTIPIDHKAAVYARTALLNIYKNQEDLALENLDKAIGV